MSTLFLHALKFILAAWLSAQAGHRKAPVRPGPQGRATAGLVIRHHHAGSDGRS